MFKPLLNKLNNMRIILASSSPQRLKILKSTDLKFEVCPSNFEENLNPAYYTFSEYVVKTAVGKAEEVYERLKNDEIAPDIIIGVDTMVTHDGKMYGKPKNREDAINIIKRLTQSEIPNMVYTGVAIKYKNHMETFTEVSTVYMGKLTEEEIVCYVDSGEPMNKAGGFGIQGIASTFIERIEGDYNNIIGLPLFRLTQKLKDLLK